MSSSFVIKVPPKRHYSENKWIRIQLLKWISFALLVTYGKAPPLKVMQKLAASAGFASWKEAQQCIQEVVEAIGKFSSLATQQTISKTTVLAIAETLAQRKKENAALLC